MASSAFCRPRLGRRSTDIDSLWNFSHPGTLGAMYSVLSLLPDPRTGFVMMTIGKANEARAVISEVTTLTSKPRRGGGCQASLREGSILTMGKVDPQADFRFDFADLSLPARV